MSIYSGNQVVLKCSGSSLTFTDEATTTTDNLVYTIADQTKKAFHPQYAFTVKVNAVAVTTPFIVDYANGSIIFPTAQLATDVVTISGKYVTTATAGRANNISINESVSIYDITAFQDTYRKRLAGIVEAEATVDDFEAIDSYYRDALNNGELILIEFQENVTEAVKRFWMVVEKFETKSGVDEVTSASISMKSFGDFNM